MQANERITWNGREFNRHFPKADGRERTVNPTARLADTVKLLPKVIAQYNHQGIRIAQRLQGKTDLETLSNVWYFCYKYLSYFPDEEGKEQIRTLARAWADGSYLGGEQFAMLEDRGIDCDCYCVFISSILHHVRNDRGGKGIAHLLRVAKYPDFKTFNPNPDYSHIYLVALSGGREIVVDPVTESFNYEAPFLDHFDLPITMELQVLSGLPDADALDLLEVSHEQLNGPIDDIRRMKEMQNLNRAKAEGRVPQSMTLEQFRVWGVNQFTQQNGMSPEAFRAKQEAEKAANAARMAKIKAANAAKWAEESKRFRQELDKRGVAYSPTATRYELLELLQKNPKRSTVGKIVNAVNKVIPVAVLLRSGILAAMKINYMGIAEKLRYALMSKENAEQKGVNPEKHPRLLRIFSKTKDTFFAAGGNERNLKHAILTGRGNRDGDVQLAGLPDPNSQSLREVLGEDLYFAESAGSLDGLSGLGEPATATALAAASAALGAIAALLKSLGNLKDGKAGQNKPTPRIPASSQGKPKGRAASVFNQAAQTITAASQAVETFNEVRNGEEASATVLYAEEDTPESDVYTEEEVDTQIVAKTAKEQEPPKGKFAEIWERNKWGILGIGGIALGGIGWAVYNVQKEKKAKEKAKSKKTLNGTPKTRTRKTTTRRKTTTKRKPATNRVKAIKIP